MREPTLIRLTILDSHGRLVTAADLTLLPWHRQGTWEEWLERVAPEWLARVQTDSTGIHHATAHAADPDSDDGQLHLLGQIEISEQQAKQAADERERAVRADIARQLGVCSCYPNPFDHEKCCPQRYPTPGATS